MKKFIFVLLLVITASIVAYFCMATVQNAKIISEKVVDAKVVFLELKKRKNPLRGRRSMWDGLCRIHFQVEDLIYKFEAFARNKCGQFQEGKNYKIKIIQKAYFTGDFTDIEYVSSE